MLHKFAIALTVIALTGCATTVIQPSGQYDDGITDTPRRPALEELHLIEGLNLVDRAPSGMSLAALVSDGKITEWRVFNDQGQVSFATRGGTYPQFCSDCRLSGGTCPPFNGGFSCCWPNWGCLDCGKKSCEMDCGTKRCKDANVQLIAPTDPTTPTPGSNVAVNPDRAIISVNPKTARWGLTDVAGVRSHVPALSTHGFCVICTTGTDRNTCWTLPCLPASIDALSYPGKIVK